MVPHFYILQNKHLNVLFFSSYVKCSPLLATAGRGISAYILIFQIIFGTDAFDKSNQSLFNFFFCHVPKRVISLFDRRNYTRGVNKAVRPDPVSERISRLQEVYRNSCLMTCKPRSDPITSPRLIICNTTGGGPPSTESDVFGRIPTTNTTNIISLFDRCYLWAVAAAVVIDNVYFSSLVPTCSPNHSIATHLLNFIRGTYVCNA